MRKASRPDKVVPIMPPPLGDRRITAVATAKTSINGRDCGIIATTPSKRFGSCEGMPYQREPPRGSKRFMAPLTRPGNRFIEENGMTLAVKGASIARCSGKARGPEEGQRRDERDDLRCGGKTRDPRGWP